MTLGMRERLLFDRARAMGILAGIPGAENWLPDLAACEGWINAEDSERNWYTGWIALLLAFRLHEDESICVRIGLEASSLVDGDGDAD